MAWFCNSYLEQLDKKAINAFCRDCQERKDNLCECDGNAVGRFCDCEILQEKF
jgi:hypothetical protein